MALSLQRQWNAYAAYALQTDLGTPATGGGNLITLSGGTGNVTQQSINSILVRQDGMSLRGRGGTFAATGQYPGELNSGNYDAILEAVMRGTWAGNVLQNPPAGSLVRRYFTIEEAELDAQVSQVYSDCVWSRFDLNATPNGMFQITPYWVGTGHSSTTTGGAYALGTPTYVNPDFVPLAAIDMTLSIGGVAQVDITAFQMTVDLAPVAPAVTGSKYSPDVFDGVMRVSIPGFSVMEQDLTFFNDFINETPLVVQIVVAEPAPGTHSLTFEIPNLTLGQATKSEMRRDGGPLTRSIQVPDARVGIDLGGTNAMVVITRA